MTRRTLLGLMATAVLLWGCSDATGPEPSLAQLAAAPTTVRMDGHELALETTVWRDFQPGDPPSGLLAVLRVVTTDRDAFPSGVTAERVSVIMGQEVWTAPVHVEQPGGVRWGLEVVARDGPAWEPGVTVDVVVHLRGPGGRRILLRHAAQPIRRIS